MSYNISSEKFNHPLLKPLLLELTEYFQDMGILFFVIGATARDIIMELHNENSGRLTHDLDIAIAINNWSQYKVIEKEIIKLQNFTKDPDQQQRFKYLNKFQLDIVPFGAIMKEKHKIFWPPNEEIAMSVLGFSAVNDSVLKVKVDGDMEIQIASLSGIFLLKVVAWRDRNHKTNKDADDMAFILQNYLEINRDESLVYYNEIYTEDHSILKGGSTLLGIHLKEQLIGHEETKQNIIEILANEIEKREESKLINQIIETHRVISFDEALESLQNIISQLTK